MQLMEEIVNRIRECMQLIATLLKLILDVSEYQR
jgi:hypothetical protein